MYIKLVSCLCFCFALIQDVKTQRINSWGTSQNNFKSSENSGFSNWNSNQGNNIFSANQNSGFDGWNSNDGPSVSGFGNVPSTWESNSFSTNNNRESNSFSTNNNRESNSFSTNNNRKSNAANSNKETWTSNSGKSNKKQKEDSPSFSFESSQNSNREFGNSNKKKNSGNSGWNSNKFTSSERPKEQNDRKWESNSVSTTNNRPKEEKLSSITNYPSSGANWNTDTNNFISSSEKDKNVYSSWGSQSSRPSDVSTSQNSRPQSWGSNSVSSNNNNNNNRPTGSNSNSVWGDEENSQNSKPQSWGSNSVSSNNNNNNNNNRPTGSNSNSVWGSEENSQNSKPQSWGSNSASNNNNNNNRPTGSNSNSVWGDEENSIYSNSGTDNNKKQSSDSGKNSGSGNWESNTQNNKKTEWNSGNNKKSNDKKSSSSNNSRPSGSGGWSSSGSSNSRPVESEFSNFGNEQPTKDVERPTEQENERKTSTQDTSILDELDKNDWYFGSEDNYPEPPFKTNLNIDVSALWNFDKNKKSNQNSDRNSNNNKRRRNRETGRLGRETRETVCECVNVNLCNEEDMIITKGDAKNYGPLIEFRCKEYTDVCCRNPINLETVRASDILEDDEENEVYSLQCGQRRLQNSFYAAFEDDMVLPGELPWMLRLRSIENDVECDGSLIHPKLVLTAAHCVEGVNPGDLNVTAGVWNSNDEPSQSRNVLDIIPHPDYNSKYPRNDIALLVLEESFRLTDNVNTICLPVTNDKWDLNGCFVADWRSNQINGKVSQMLGKGFVEFLPQYECQNILLVTEFWRKYILHDSFICAVERNGKDVCLGEQGGALICPSKKLRDTYLQIGIVSKSLNCDDIGGPGIITNVLHFLDWINKNIFELGLYDIDVRNL